MGTRSTIALEYADGSIKQIYCHWNGYISGVGATLFEHYDTPEKVNELLSQGDARAIDKTINECNFYARDRGETGVEASNYQSYDHFMKNAGFQEYDYIMREGVWYLIRDKRSPLESLADLIAEDED
jgi:hypothetical protein